MIDDISGVSVLMNKKLFIFDMDGTIYLGGRVFPGAVSYIKHLRESGRRVLFFTNNASHVTDFYVQKLNRMGFDTNAGEIMTSADVTSEFLVRNRPEKNIYLVGTRELAAHFRRAGIRVLRGTPERADIVVSSFDTELTYKKLDNACRLIRNGAEFLSTHPDFNCPTENGFIPDSGAIAAFITASTGKTPRYFGKPYGETVDMIREVTGICKEDMCVFGDRLYTDIAVGKRHGVTSVLVLTGETKLEDAEEADESESPDYIFESLGKLDGMCGF